MTYLPQIMDVFKKKGFYYLVLGSEIKSDTHIVKCLCGEKNHYNGNLLKPNMFELDVAVSDWEMHKFSNKSPHRLRYLTEYGNHLIDFDVDYNNSQLANFNIDDLQDAKVMHSNANIYDALNTLRKFLDAGEEYRYKRRAAKLSHYIGAYDWVCEPGWLYEVKENIFGKETISKLICTSCESEVFGTYIIYNIKGFTVSQNGYLSTKSYNLASYEAKACKSPFESVTFTGKQIIGYQLYKLLRSYIMMDSIYNLPCSIKTTVPCRVYVRSDGTISDKEHLNTGITTAIDYCD